MMHCSVLWLCFQHSSRDRTPLDFGHIVVNIASFTSNVNKDAVWRKLSNDRLWYDPDRPRTCDLHRLLQAHYEGTEAQQCVRKALGHGVLVDPVGERQFHRLEKETKDKKELQTETSSLLSL